MHNLSDILKLYKQIPLPLLIPKIFVWVRMPDFREGQVKNRTRTGKLVTFTGNLGAIISILP